MQQNSQYDEVINKIAQKAVDQVLKLDEKHGDIGFNDGSRGELLKQYAQDMATARINSSPFIDSVNERLAPTYEGLLYRKNGQLEQVPITPEQARDFAISDEFALLHAVNNLLPNSSQLREGLKEALKPSFEAQSSKLIVGETHPKRSDLLVPFLIERSGVEGGRKFAEAAKEKLKGEFKGVAKEEGGTVGDYEAGQIVEEAAKITTDFLNTRLGKVFTGA